MNKDDLAYFQMEERYEELSSWDYDDCYSDTYEDVDNLESDTKG